jgi:hypothetical protein
MVHCVCSVHAVQFDKSVILAQWALPDTAVALFPGANVVLTTKGIDDMTLKYFVEAGVLAVRRVPKDDLK